MDLRSRSINKADIETLFRDVLTQSQIVNISNLLKLLGMYVFLERRQLDFLAEQHFGGKIGLSYVQKAIKYNLVAEMQYDGNYDTYYFQCKSGGYMFLDAIGYKYRKLPLDAAKMERSKILSINDYLIANGHLLTNIHDFGLYEPLFTQKSVVLHADIPKETLILQLSEMGLGFTIVQMDLVGVKFDEKTKGNMESML